MLTSYPLYIIALLALIYIIYDTYKQGGVKSVVSFLALFGFLFFTVRTYIVQPFQVEGPSMQPTFQTGNYLLVDRFTYRISDVQRNSVLVFDIPDHEGAYHSCVIPGPSFINEGCLYMTNRYLIKRVIGLPGEKVSVVGGVTTIFNTEYPNGKIMDESFVQFKSPLSSEVTLKDDEYFVMGDNRANSSDSRYWGPVPKDKIVGRPVLRLWPLNEIGVLPGSL
jgi:signal peptidase I